MRQIEHHILFSQVIRNIHWILHLIFREVITQPNLDPSLLVNPQHLTVNIERPILLKEQTKGYDRLHQHINRLRDRQLQLTQPHNPLRIGIGLIGRTGIAPLKAIIQDPHKGRVRIPPQLVVVDVVVLLLFVIEVEDVDFDL